MKNPHWEIVNAIADNCASYDPDKTKPTPVKSEKLWTLYDCKNFVQWKNGLWQCLWCQILDDKMTKEKLQENLA